MPHVQVPLYYQPSHFMKSEIRAFR